MTSNDDTNTKAMYKDAWIENGGDGDRSGIMSTYYSYSQEHRNEIENRLRKKIDTRVLPMVVLIYLFNYLDRNSITQARLYGLQEDTGLKGAEYNTAISIFSAGYILMQIPSTILMTKLRPSLFLPTVMIIWAIVSGCTGATHNPAGILVVRLFLGFVEAPFFPAVVYFLSCWYTKKEIGVRMALLICGILLANAFAGLISAGILSGMGGVAGLEAWRWLFIIEGLATVVLGVIAYFVLPDFPGTTKWLSEEEKIVAQGRLAADAGSETILDEEKVPISRGLIWAAKDIRTWIFACLQLCVTASISFSHFFPTLVQQLGFTDNMVVLLLTSPPYVVAFFWAIGWAWWADRLQARSLSAGISQTVGMVGTILMISVTNVLWARYAFTFLVTCGTFGVYSTTYAWLSSTLTQPPVKRAVAIGIANTCANIASLFANYFWLDKYEPSFTVSWGCLLAFEALGMSCILCLRFLLVRANKRFDELATNGDVDDLEFTSQLDEDSKKALFHGFRYVI